MHLLIQVYNHFQMSSQVSFSYHKLIQKKAGKWFRHLPVIGCQPIVKYLLSVKEVSNKSNWWGINTDLFSQVMGSIYLYFSISNLIYWLFLLQHIHVGAFLRIYWTQEQDQKNRARFESTKNWITKSFFKVCLEFFFH